MKYVICLLLMCSVFVNTASGTAQINDRIFVRGEITLLHNTPLESYFDDCKLTRKRIGGQVLRWGTTANYRGYVATWEIKSDTLYLRKVKTKSFNHREVITTDLVKEFGTEEVVAKWYSGYLSIPRGEPIDYLHLGFGYVYDYYEIVEVKNGVVVRQYLSFNKEESRAIYRLQVDEELLCSINSLSDVVDYMPDFAQLLEEVGAATEKRNAFLNANDDMHNLYDRTLWIIEIFPDESLPDNQLRYNWFNSPRKNDERFGFDTGVLTFK